MAEPESPVSLTGKYLMVELAGESYGIAVLNVREIIRLQKITPVPQMAAHVKGVINLRGRVIPVLDLRVRFGLPAAFTERSCIVVVQTVSTPGSGSRPLGLIVDGVDEVAQVSADEIEPPPEFSAHVDTRCLLGLAKVKGQVKTLLDIQQVFSGAKSVADAD